MKMDKKFELTKTTKEKLNKLKIFLDNFEN